MGQYYKAVNLDEQAYLMARDYDAGIKLMEHAWVGTKMVGAMCQLLADEWKGHRIVWAGDYGDEGLFLDHLPEGHPEKDCNLYRYARSLFTQVNRPMTKEVAATVNEEYPFLVCLDRKEYVDLRALPFSEDGWRIHPLPLLTSNGNGNGGGDYHSDFGRKYVGTWAGMRVAVEKEAPDGYGEIKPDFKKFW